MLVDLIGRFTFYKLYSGSLYFDGLKTHIITLSWNSFRECAFKSNNRLFLEHFSSTDSHMPPGARTHPGSVSYVLDTIVFGPTLGIRVIEEPGEDPKLKMIRIYHMSVDYWNPAYLSYKHIPQDLILDYTNELSNVLLSIWGKKLRTEIDIEPSKKEATRMLLDDILLKFKLKVQEYVSDPKLVRSYLYFIEQGLYDYLFIGLSSEKDSERLNLKEFLEGKRTTHKISLKLSKDYIPLIKLKDASIDLTELDLDKSDFIDWENKGLNEIFSNSIRLKVRNVKDLKLDSILSDLKDPISNLGKNLKNIGLKYGSMGKKIAIIPFVTYSHGLGQRVGRSNQNNYLKSTNDIVKLQERAWDCWILDGTNDGADLESFNVNYKFVLRSLLEGHITLLVVAFGEDNEDFSVVESFNILQGALDIDELIFTTNKIDYKVFTNLESLDSSYYSFENEYNLLSVMRSFKRHSLPLLSVSRDWSSAYWNRWTKHSYIRDFF